MGIEVEDSPDMSVDEDRVWRANSASVTIKIFFFIIIIILLI